MSGGAAGNVSMQPPLPDYTAAMGMVSGNNMITALGAQGAQVFGVMESSMNRSEITAAHLQEGLERIDERLDESKLNYQNDRLQELDHHDEKMLEIKTAQNNPTTQSTSGFGTS